MLGDDVASTGLNMTMETAKTNFLETKQGNIKCIFNSCDEQKIQKAAENMAEIRNELKNTVVEVQKDKNGRLNFAVSDSTHGKSGKSITMRFCEKEKFQRVLQEQFGYDRIKSVEATNILSAKLTSEQSKYFRSGSKLTEQMDYYEHNVKFENDNLLTSDYTFTQLKMKNDNDMKLSITDKDGNYVILTQSNTDRNLAEENIRKYLQISDSEKLDAILIDMSHSDNYNPFHYIFDADGNYSETSVIKMINVLMKKYKGG